MTGRTVENLGGQPSRPLPPRTGMILAVVLVALLVLMLLGAALANALLAQRRLLRHHEQQQRAFWLADSALHRAVYRLANEPGYRGETWQVTADELGGTHPGAALIRVEASAEAESQSLIVIDASYPSDAVQRTVQHREGLVAQPTE